MNQVRARLEESIWPVILVLAALIIVVVPELGSDPWDFVPGAIDPNGPLGWLVRIADSEWDEALLRASALLGGVLVAVAAAVALRVDRWRGWVAIAFTATVVALITVPGVLLQVGLRDSSEPWFFTNDSTYQIELAGDLVLDGSNPYGHDYSTSGLERFYSLDGTVTETAEEQVALSHFAYFPGTVYNAAVWRLLPSPLDDYRLFVLLCTLGLFVAALAFPGPLPWRLAAGAMLAANPLAARAAWFGVADAPSILLVVLAFALCARSRFAAAAACVAGAVLLKQFALVAVPFIGAMIVLGSRSRREAWTAAGIFAGMLAAGFLPFLIADAQALYDDTIAYGADTYRIIGYGVAGILVETGIIDDRTDPYPFALIATLVWLPATVWLVWNHVRSRELWTAAAGFALSVFVLLYIGRVLQNSYLVWPLAGATVAVLLALGVRARGGARAG